MNTGKVKCWGDNGRGALGDGTRINRMIAVDVLGINDAIAIASGAFHNCALLANGGVKCWGQNDLGQLGNGTFTDSDTPSEVIGLSGKATQLSINGNTTCARMEEGTARCWGANGSGQIGDGTTINRSTPVKVSGLSNVVSIAAGYLHSCALIGPDSIAVCWGANSFGEIGDGTKNNRLTSVPVIGLSGSIAKISPGGVHTCVLYTFGNVQCWGADHYGQLGNGLFGASSPTPVDANGLYKNVVEISAQSDHTCVMFDSGGVRCWGRNHQGQIGDGTFADKNLPTQVIGLSSGAVKILAGLDTSCAILDTGSIKCWGSNTYGQAGDGTTVNRAAPVNVLALDRN